VRRATAAAVLVLWQVGYQAMAPSSQRAVMKVSPVLTMKAPGPAAVAIAHSDGISRAEDEANRVARWFCGQ